MSEDCGNRPAAAPSQPAEPDPKRRGLLATMFGSWLGLGFTAFGAANGLWAAATARFMMPNVVTEPPNRFKAGLPGEYPAGFVERIFTTSC